MEMASMQRSCFDFTKVFCPHTCSQKMEIPISYKETENRSPCNVILRRCSSWTKFWCIEITETGDGIFFEKGWAEFVEANSFKNGEVLVFKYIGDGVYDFSIMDSSYCENIMVHGAQAELKGLKENDGDGAQADIVNEVKKEEEENDDGHHTRSKRKRCIAARGSKRAKKRDASAEKKDIPDHFGADLFKSGRYAQPTNPYFVTRLRPRRRNALYVPKEVITGHKIVFPPTVTLRDPNGKEWTSKVQVWGDGRTWLNGGWKNLCRWNLVVKHERCICEFVPSLGPDMVLQVTVVRE